jgi:hypothetical protein
MSGLVETLKTWVCPLLSVLSKMTKTASFPVPCEQVMDCRIRCLIMAGEQIEPNPLP